MYVLETQLEVAEMRMLRLSIEMTREDNIWNKHIRKALKEVR